MSNVEDHSQHAWASWAERTGRWVVAVVVLIGGAVFAWPGQIDDAYISLVFSHELVETGRMAWSDGRIVEGYSNLAWVLLGSLAALLQLDGGLVLQVSALLATLATLFILLPPGDSKISYLSLLVPVSLAAAEPTAWWAANAMEAPAFGLCLALGWRALLVTERVPLGIVMLSLSALLRPEGHVHLLLGLMVTQPRLLRSNPAALGSVIATFSLYHIARVNYFGELLPLPTMVKGVDGPGILQGLHQSGLDLLPWLGLMGLAAGLSGVSTRAQRLALVPLLIQLAVLTKAGGDWMGHGRLVLPGVIAALGVWTTQQRHLPFRRRHVLLMPLAALPALIVSPTGTPTQIQSRDLAGIVSTLMHPRLDLDTTLMTDLQFVIPRLPKGAMIYAGDVGMLGHVPELVVRDMVGLTDADIARSRAFGDHEALERTMERLDGGPDSALCLRMVGWGASAAPDLPIAQARAYPETYELSDSWSKIRWSCRSALHMDPVLNEQRWAALARRFPFHTWIQWNHALAIAENGELDRALDRLVSSSAAWRWGPWEGNERAALLFTTSSGPLHLEEGSWFVVEPGTRIKTRPLSGPELDELELEVDFDSTTPRLEFTTLGQTCQSDIQYPADQGSGRVKLGKGECGEDSGPFQIELISHSSGTGRIRQSNF